MYRNVMKKFPAELAKRGYNNFGLEQENGELPESHDDDWEIDDYGYPGDL
ncbi:MAG: hypothetical protein QM537_03060 [Candidatus Symbiobacter sp.]|nr:hypothetical protein [Candidatus Symbiobacter sp.]